MDSVELPIDVFGLLIDSLPIHIAIRFILSSKKLYSGPGWKLLKSIELDLDSPRSATSPRTTTPCASSSSSSSLLYRTGSSEHTERVITALLHRLPQLTPPAVTRLNLICPLSFYSAVYFASGRIEELLRALAPNLEEISLRNDLRFSDPRAFLLALNPAKLRKMYCATSSGNLDAAFLWHSWPALTELYAPIAVDDLPKLTPQNFPRLKVLQIAMVKNEGPRRRRFFAAIPELLSALPNLVLLAVWADFDQKDLSENFHATIGFTSSNKFIFDNFQNLWTSLAKQESLRLKLASTLRLAGVPLWRCWLGSVAQNALLFDAFYQNNNSFLLGDLCAELFRTAKNRASLPLVNEQTIQQITWMEQMMTRYYEAYAPWTPPQTLLRGLVGLCACLSATGATDIELAWRNTLINCIVIDEYCITSVLKLIDPRREEVLIEWITGTFQSHPQWLFNRYLVKTYHSFKSYIVPTLELDILIVKDQEFDHSDWLLNYIVALMRLGKKHLDDLDECLSVACNKGYHGTFLRISDSSASAWPGWPFNFGDKGGCLGTGRMIFRVFEDAYLAINVEMVQSCYFESKSLDLIDSLLEERCSVGFEALYPESSPEIARVYAEAIWQFVFVAPQAELETLLPLALSKAKPFGRYRNILLANADKQKYSSTIFGLSMERIKYLQNALQGILC